MNFFNKLKQISNDYKIAVDELGPEYQREGVRDHLWADEVRQRMIKDRNSAYNAKIDKLVQDAQKAAAPIIAELRGALQKYIAAPADPAQLQTLQAILSAGLEMSDAELEEYAKSGNYTILRLLEKPSKGHIIPPDLSAFQHDVKELQRHFENLSSYRGELAQISPQQDRRWSVIQNTTTASVLDGFSKKVDEMAQRWIVLEHGKEV